MILKNRIKKIIDAIKDSDINEIEISSFWGSQKIKMKRNQSNEFSPQEKDFKESDKKNSVIEPINTSFNEKNETDGNSVDNLSLESQETIEEDYELINAPLVGTFYLSPKPGEPPFVKENDTVKIGDTLCIIEAMKIFNDIESENSGKIIEILVNDGDPVEYDQPLFKIKKS